jgi:hypothetical protein
MYTTPKEGGKDYWTCKINEEKSIVSSFISKKNPLNKTNSPLISLL